MGVSWPGAAVWDSRLIPCLCCSLGLRSAAWEGLRSRATHAAGWDPREPQWSEQSSSNRGEMRLKRLSSISACEDNV